MRPVVIIVLALAATFALEVLFDLGVLAALLIAAIGLIAKQDALAILMPIAAWFCVDPEWARTTPILYGAFVLVAIVTGFVTRRRPPFISAAVGILILLLEIVRR